MALPKKILIDYISDDDKHWTWEPPEIPKFAGPSDLANLLINYRATLESIRNETGHLIESVGEISDRGLDKLLDFAYRASFLKDEGRPVVARFFVPDREEKQSSAKEPFAGLAGMLVTVP